MCPALGGGGGGRGRGGLFSNDLCTVLRQRYGLPSGGCGEGGEGG